MHIHPFTHWGKTKEESVCDLVFFREAATDVERGHLYTDVANASWSFSQQLTLYLQALETQEASLINNQDRIG